MSARKFISRKPAPLREAIQKVLADRKVPVPANDLVKLPEIKEIAGATTVRVMLCQGVHFRWWDRESPGVYKELAPETDEGTAKAGSREADRQCE